MHNTVFPKGADKEVALTYVLRVLTCGFLTQKAIKTELSGFFGCEQNNIADGLLSLSFYRPTNYPVDIL